MPGVSNLVVAGDLVTCDLEGDRRAVPRGARRAPVADLTIEPARLEDAFLELYEGDPADDAGGGS